MRQTEFRTLDDPRVYTRVHKSSIRGGQETEIRVEGSTLADRISKGPIPLDEALPIAK